MNFSYYLSCVFVFAVLASCNENEGHKKTSTTIIKDQVGDKVSENDFIAEYLVRDLPFTDSTTFDQFDDEISLTQDQAKILELNKIVKLPDFNTIEKHINYRLDISPQFRTLVFTIFPNENEIETILVNYDLDFHVIDYKTIAYDEISESCKRVISTIKNAEIEIIEFNFCSNTEIKTTLFYTISEKGKIIKRP